MSNSHPPRALLTRKEQQLLNHIRDNPALTITEHCAACKMSRNIYYRAVRKPVFLHQFREIATGIVREELPRLFARLVERAENNTGALRLATELTGDIKNAPLIEQNVYNNTQVNTIPVAQLRKDYDNGQVIEIPDINHARREELKAQGYYGEASGPIQRALEPVPESPEVIEVTAAAEPEASSPVVTVPAVDLGALPAESIEVEGSGSAAAGLDDDIF